MLHRPWLLWLLLTASIQHRAHATTAVTEARYVVGVDDNLKPLLQEQLLEHGYRVITSGPGFLTVSHSADSRAVPSTPLQLEEGNSSTASTLQAGLVRHDHKRMLIEDNAAAHTQHTQFLGKLEGVHISEQDVRRHLHMRPSLLQHGTTDAHFARSLAAAASTSTSDSEDAAHGLSKLLGHWHMNQQPRARAYEQWGADVVDAACAAKDIQLRPDVADSEVLPWGIKAVGANDVKLQKLPPKGRTIVCVIDSGLWSGHPEYRAPAVAGRSAAPKNSFSGCKTSGDCPFEWYNDIVGHGTHVAGTIGAPENGIGVIGVMSQGAEVHVVRVWNNNGDVSQGQGPYATDLVLAYSQCLDHLKAEQAKDSSKKVNMVINMSFGSAGPLTVERLWMQKAAKRGDVLFVGSAGNNGSWLDVGKRAAGAASLSGKEPVGQYLSYPASYQLDEMLSVANARCDGSIEFTSQKNKQVSLAAPGMAVLSSVPQHHGMVRGHISTTPQVTSGTAPRTVGFLANGFLEPRPVLGASISTTPSLPLISCTLGPQQRMWPFASRQDTSTCPQAQGAICFMQLPGRAPLSEEACTAMSKCIKSGGAGLVMWQQKKQADVDAFFSIPGAQLDCGPTCKCWADLKASLGCTDMQTCASKTRPAIMISPQHAAALTSAGAGQGGVKATISSYAYYYKYFDGTSMAAPHVSGAAALLWRLFPKCKAADIAHALKMSAQRLQGQQQVPDYSAGYGMLRVDQAYEWMLQHSACAKS